MRQRSVICVNNSLDGLSAMFIRWLIQRWNNPEGDSRRRGRMNALDHSRGKACPSGRLFNIPGAKVREAGWGNRHLEFRAALLAILRAPVYVSQTIDEYPLLSPADDWRQRVMSDWTAVWWGRSVCSQQARTVLLSVDGLDWRSFGSFPDEPVTVFLNANNPN